VIKCRGGPEEEDIMAQGEFKVLPDFLLCPSLAKKEEWS